MFVEDMTAFFDAEGFGDDAVYQPVAGGPSVALVVVMLRPTARSPIGQLGVDLPTNQALASADDLPDGSPAVGDTVTIAEGENAGTYTVQTFRPDSTGRIWTLELSEPA